MVPPVRRAFQAFETLCQELTPEDARAAVGTLLFHRLSASPLPSGAHPPRAALRPEDEESALIASGIRVGTGGVSRSLVQLAAALLSLPPSSEDDLDARAELLGGAHEALMTAERRARGLHYTPRALTGPIVTAALAPVFRALAPKPCPEDVLALRICDPAMGSGAFLLEVCRQLGDRLASAMDGGKKTGRSGNIAALDEGLIREARLLIARNCVFGVDRDPGAVIATRRSLALLTGHLKAPEDLAASHLCVGDALVGVSIDQLRWFSVRPPPTSPPPPLADLWTQVVRGHRPLAHALTVADLLVRTHFEGGTSRQRQALSEKLLGLVRELKGQDLPASLVADATATHKQHSPFHWELLFGVQPFDAIVGNPPFLGGKRISTVHGHDYTAWLTSLHDVTKNADLAAHFFRRGAALLKPRGTISLIATNTIAQGATRAAGLGWLLDHGFEIYRAKRSHRWPGDANVSIAIVHLSRGFETPSRSLDDRPALAIDSRLKPSRERPAPRRLRENRNVGFVGCFLRGEGFILGEAEQTRVIDADPTSAKRIFPYLGGEEVNTSPSQSHHRYVIDFGDMSREAADAFPEVLNLLRLRVKPVRDRLSDSPANRAHKRYWWRFANPRRELRVALSKRTRCLVTARVTKHLSFAFQPTDRVFSEQLLVFDIDDYARFGVLESRIHGTWGRLHSSSLGEGLRYTPSQAFETFPFPIALRPHCRSNPSELGNLAETLYQRRAALMVRMDCGLTAVRDHLLDPFAEDPEVIALRAQYEALDRAVLRAYGWTGIEVIPYRCAIVAAEKDAVLAYENAIVDRLYEENCARKSRH